jgi:hypothetical protein
LVSLLVLMLAAAIRWWWSWLKCAELVDASHGAGLGKPKVKISARHGHVLLCSSNSRQKLTELRNLGRFSSPD